VGRYLVETIHNQNVYNDKTIFQIPMDSGQ